MTLAEEFKAYIAKAHGSNMDPESHQYREMRDAFFAGAMVGGTIPYSQLVRDGLVFFAEVRAEFQSYIARERTAHHG